MAEEGKSREPVLNVVTEEGVRQYKLVLPPIEKMPPDIYSNHMVVSHGPHEFTLYFSRMEAPTSMHQLPQESDIIELPVYAKIIIPLTLMRSVIRALQQNLETCEKHYGPIVERKEQE